MRPQWLKQISGPVMTGPGRARKVVGKTPLMLRTQPVCRLLPITRIPRSQCLLFIAWLRSRPVHSTFAPTMLPSLFVVLLSGFTATALPLDDNFEIANGETIKDFKDQANSIHFCSKSLNIFLLQVARLQYWCERRSATLLISSTRPSMSTRRDSQPKVC